MRRVLVVDDDSGVVQVLKAMLEERFEVMGATDAHIALEMIAAGKVDILVTDLLMPDMDGFGLILKARRAMPGIPVVLISAYIDKDDPMARRILTRYTDFALAKPVRREELVAAVAQLSQVPAQRATPPSPPD